MLFGNHFNPSFKMTDGATNITIQHTHKADHTLENTLRNITLSTLPGKKKLSNFN